ncbi:MAG: D-alanyl-D-alanine carboxypeptidase family protein [Clostridia bacterium]|nr:D-alanyl-D-alanine carboxypeptidase family protein [Clostridia bacterium]
MKFLIRYLKLFAMICILSFICSPICFASSLDNVFVWSAEGDNITNSPDTIDNQNNNIETNASSISSDENIINTVETSGDVIESTNSLTIESGSGILIEQNSGKVLFEHNSHEQLRPASVTKVMTILLIMEAIDSGKITLEDSVPCSENASNMGGSQIWLDPKETLTVHEMLKAICVVSANDCTVAMAEYLAGSEEAFVEQMNSRASELGMNDTCFKNCHGLDEDGHLTSSFDISLMSRELLVNHPSITNYTTIWMDSLRDGKSELVNTNKLIRNYNGTTGLKTGSTSLALYNLSASATRDNLSLIAVIMKAPTTSIRFADSQKLLNYGFSNYIYKSFGNKGDTVKNINVSKGISTTVEGILENSSGVLLRKNDEQNVEQIINIPDITSAPIESGSILGKIEYKLNDEIIGSVNVVSKNSVKKIGFWTTTTHLLQNLFIRSK